MPRILKILIAIALIAFFHYLFYHLEKPYRIIPKCAATAVCVVSAAIGLSSRGLSPLSSLLFWAIVLCCIGDALLEFHFVSGMAAFALGHVLLIVWLLKAAGGFSAAGVMIGILGYVAAFAFFRGHLASLGDKKLAFLLYPAVLMTMAAAAVTLLWRIGPSAICVSLGGMLFAVSDMFVAQGFFEGLTRVWDQFALAIYYLAVFLLSLGAWMI